MTSRAHLPAVFAILALLGAPSATAQEPEDPIEAEQWKNGFLPTGTYAGPNLSVNLYNGNVIASIPLVSLPGRAGHDLNLTLSYNSRQLVRYHDGTLWRARWFNDGPTTGRWVINAWPSLKEDVPYQKYYFTTPDGAVHKLDRQGSWGLYAEDGTNIRYNVNNQRVEYFGGTHYDFSEFDSQNRVYYRDRHGNQITYEYEDHNNVKRPVRIVDTLGREALLGWVDSPSPYTNLYGRLDSVTVKNHAGADLVHRFEYALKSVEPFITAYRNNNKYAPYRYYGCEATDAAGEVDALSKVILPDGRSFEFDYNEDAIYNPWLGYTAYRSTIQMTRMKLPSEAEIAIDYQEVAGHENNRIARHVSSITTDPVGGGAFTTSYAYNWDASLQVTKTTETRADGSKHIVDWNPSGEYAWLRQFESWTDTDGATVLREAETGWQTVGSGATVSWETVRDPQTQWEMKVTRDSDEFGREVKREVFDQRATRNWAGSLIFSFVSNTVVRRHYSSIDWLAYRSDLLDADVYRYLPTQSNPGSNRLRLVASAEYEYDQHPLLDRGAVVGQASGYGPSNTDRGNLTTVRRHLISENRTVTARTWYDTVGNAVETEDAEGAHSHLDYSAAFHYAYPTGATNALGHTTSADYNFNTGLPVSATDANGQTASYQYETHNRISREDRPDGGWTTYAYIDNLNAGNGSKYRGRREVRRRVFGSAYSRTLEYFDGLGRPLRAQTQEPNGAWIMTETEYALCSCTGKTKRTSLPYLSGETVRWTEARYDGIGRIVKLIPPDGTASSNHTEYRYGATPLPTASSWVTRYPIEAVFDARGVGQARLTDAMGRLVEVREDADYSDFSSSTVTAYRQYIDASAPYVQRWKYYTGSQIYQQEWVQASTRLYNVIQQGVQTRTFQRDTLGRPESETHPESGTTVYAWSDAGRLQSKTDARGIVTSLGYDALGRPLTIDYSDGTPSAWYEYDLGAYGIGRVSLAANANASTSYTYDAMGRVTQTRKTVGGMLFTLSTAYNHAGLPTATALPDGTVITDSYDRMGRLTQVASDRVDATHPAVLASNFVYHSNGAALSVEWGNGTVTERTLNEKHQLKTLRHGPASDPGQFLDLEYDYDEGVANTGRIMSIVDRNDTSRTVNYTYDDFNRLKTAATAGAHWGLSWTYDRYGNRLAQTKTKGTAPTNSLSVNAASNRVNGWSYDAAGNTLNDGKHAYTYDANNMIKGVDGGAVQYRYDAAGRRVSKVTAAETVHYALGSEYSTVSGWKRVSVAVGGVRVEYGANETYFQQSDHLGTPRVQTDSAGNLIETWSHYPFGEQWEKNGSGGNEHRFTGHLRDPETGNDYAGARYFKSPFGRWLSPEPDPREPETPQQVNRYSYAFNDPVNYVDPDGRWPVVRPFYGPNEEITVYAGHPSTFGIGGGGGAFHPRVESEWHGPQIGGPPSAEFKDRMKEAAIARIMQSESCRQFLEKVIEELANMRQISAEDRQRFGYDLSRLTNGIQSAMFRLAEESEEARQYFENNPDVDAAVLSGDLRFIYFRSVARMTEPGLIIHEAFHVSTQGSDDSSDGGFAASDESLAAAAGHPGLTGRVASEAFSREVNSACL